MKTKKAKDIMTTDVIVAKKDDNISSVANLLIQQKIGGLPVVDEKYKVVGIISETDIIQREKHISPPEYVNILQGLVLLEDLKVIEQDIRKIASYKVEDLMSTEIIKVNEEDSFDDIANVMIRKSVNRVPVVDEENTLKGIICRYDIIKAMYNE